MKPVPLNDNCSAFKAGSPGNAPGMQAMVTSLQADGGHVTGQECMPIGLLVACVATNCSANLEASGTGTGQVQVEKQCLCFAISGSCLASQKGIPAGLPSMG